jgi:hypothetical protein
MTTKAPTTEMSPGEAVALSMRGWIIAGVAGLLVSLAIISPYFWLGNASGHDFEFHAASWLEVASQWKQHIAYPRWHESANYGFGEPRFIFYPPLSWMLGAGLSFVVPWNAVPGVFIVLTQIIACLSAFAFARRWLPAPAAIVAAMFYAANPYALLVIYMRSDFAEQLASAFLPLVFLAAFHLAEAPAGERLRAAKAAVLFALPFAAVWLANAPAGVLASYSVALLFVWTAVSQRNWQLLVRGVGALTLGFGLTGFYLVPAAYEQKWVNIGQILSTGLLPTDNFLYTAGNDPEHTFFNWIASTIAIVLTILTLTAAMAALRRTQETNEQKRHATRRDVYTLLVISAAAILLMLRLSSVFWLVLPKLRFVQFPWRWMAILAMPCALFLGACWLRRAGPFFALAALAISLSAGIYLVRHTWWDADDIPTLRAALQHGKGFEGTDEYDPAGDDHYNLPQSAPPVRILAERDDEKPATAAVSLQEWTPENRRLRIHSRERARLALRLLDYPAWRVEVNGRVVAKEHPEQSGQMIVPVPAGESQVRIVFAQTADRTTGAAISGLSLLVAISLLIWPRPEEIQ